MAFICVHDTPLYILSAMPSPPRAHFNSHLARSARTVSTENENVAEYEGECFGTYVVACEPDAAQFPQRTLDCPRNTHFHPPIPLFCLRLAQLATTFLKELYPPPVSQHL